MSEVVPQSWEGNPKDIPTLIWSDVPVVKNEQGELDGDIEILSGPYLVPNFGGSGLHREVDVRQTPSNISRGEL